MSGSAARRIPGAGASQDAWARAAGVGYLVIIAAGIFAEFGVRQGLVVPGDPGATARALAGAETLYRAGLAADLVMLVADVAVAAALYAVFRPVSRGLALLAAFFRLAQAAVLGMNVVLAYLPLLLLGGAGSVAPEPAPVQALVSLDLHAYAYAVGLVFFGVHCLVLAHLAYHSGYVPRILGVLLLVAGLGYLADGFGRTLLSDYAAYEPVVAVAVFVPAFVGELSFALWLTVRGVDAEATPVPG